MDNPAISVILPVYNGADYLKDSIRSVLDQAFSNFELIIIDDASKDDTWSALQSFSDPRIRLSRNETNGGLFANLNRLVLMCRAPLVKLWAQDDLMRPNCLEEGISFFKKYPDLGYAYTDNYIIDGLGREILYDRIDRSPIVFEGLEADRYSLFHGCLSANIANLFFPRWVFDDVGFFREDYISGDFELLVRIQGRYRIGRIPEKLVTVRSHRKQLSRGRNSLEWALSNDMDIYDTLRDRLVAGGVMSMVEAREICEKKYALNSFHGGIRLVLAGRLRSAFRVFRLLKRFAPLHRYFAIWSAGLARHISRRLARRAAAR